MKRNFTLFVFLLVTCGLRAFEVPEIPYAPAAGQAGSTALAYDNERIKGWATAVASIEYGLEVSEEWKTPAMALGPAAGVDPSVLVLGRGGRVVLAFEPVIGNGEGDDFAVFENGITDSFLELAYVEVSTDGVHFVRFPNYSLTDAPVLAFGEVDPTYIHGLAGKYRAGYGTPFDLQELADAHAAVVAGFEGFSSEYSQHLLENFAALDLENIRYVRLIDIPGDGSAKDCQGYSIYDPYPTIISAGFDLDAVGVINQGGSGIVSFAEWSSSYGLTADPYADTDGDKWPQYLEYLSASIPTDAGNRPVVKQSLSTSGHYIVEYTRNESAGQAVAVYLNHGNGQWEPFAGDSVVVDSSRLGGIIRSRVRIEIPSGGSPLLICVAAAAP